MAKSLRQEPVALGPFPLIETPAHAQNLTKPYDAYIEAASIMALAHNMLLRGLNSIYLQAPHISSADAGDFIFYAKCWVEVLEHHHKMEEDRIFPWIEEQTGEEGIMEGNVEQHHAFLPGLQAFSAYLNTVSANPISFSGTRLITLIDDFAPSLTTHIADEIPSLLSLSRFGPSLDLLGMINAEGAKTPLHLTKTGGVPFFFRNLDVEFEDGRWREWPGVPGLVWWVLQRTVVGWYSAWWRFASCDARGRLREMPALGSEKE